MTRWEEFWEKIYEKDPEARKEYERLGPLYDAITDTLRLRYDLGLTQAQLAERMGKQQPAIARFEAGNSNPTLAFLQSLAEALDAKLTVHIEPREAVEAEPASGRRHRVAEGTHRRYESASAEVAEPLLGESEG